MTVDPTVIPGLLLLALELLALAAVGYVVARVALRQSNDLMALAQGMVIGPALWGLTVNFVMYLSPGLAGALATWVVMLALAALLAWRSPAVLRLPARTMAGFGAAALALFWVVLAGRQMLAIPDDINHLTLAAQFRAGGWPPAFAWNPGISAAYHHGVDLLVGLLAPPFGPDMAFTTELLGAWIWTSLAFILGAALLQRGGWTAALILTPLLLSNGTWTLIRADPPGIVQILVPAGLPAEGIRASLIGVYWPSVDIPWPLVESVASPPNIWKPPFVLAYSLGFIVLERATRRTGVSWPAVVTLAALLGFQGLVDETMALLTLAIWGGLAIWRIHALRKGQTAGWPRAALRASVGPALAALLLVGGGGVITSIITSSSGSGLSLGWNEDPGSRRSVAGIESLDGGLGLLWLGPVSIVCFAVLLNRSSRLVLALAGGSVVSLLGLFLLQYEYGHHDTVRFDGHARNFALLALLLALAFRLSVLRPRWHYLGAALLAILVVWPTVAEPVQNLHQSFIRGPNLANAQDHSTKFHNPFLNRTVIDDSLSVDVAAYIKEHTAVGARVLSTAPNELSILTGRPNASGLVQSLQFLYFPGPEFRDAIRDLDPGAVRRLGIGYVHSTDAWVGKLPDRVQQRLEDPDLFELLIRGDGDALYRVRPAFLVLGSEPETFEALRDAVPSSASVYLAPSSEPLSWVRAASALSHTRLFGVLRTHISMHYRANFHTEPLDGVAPDLVVLPVRGLAPSAIAPAQRAPIWWNDELAVYAPAGLIAPLRDPPPQGFSVQLSDVRTDGGRISFTAEFLDRSAEEWVGQDWLVTTVDGSPWAFPHEFEDDGRHKGMQWYAGQLTPAQATATHTYQFDPRTVRLEVRNEHGVLTSVASSGAGLELGEWTLGVRLRHEWHEAAFIPVMKIVVAESGVVAYEVYEGELNARLAR